MKLSEYAKLNNVTYRTAWQWYADGKIPNARQLETGTIVIDKIEERVEKTAVYARVSSSENKGNLNTQSKRVQDFVSLVTSFTARLYGKRRSKRATEKIIKELNEND